jgi:hypothetical protein
MKQQIAAAWNAGLTAREIARALGCTPRYVFSVRHEMQLPRRRRGRRKINEKTKV